MGVSGGSEVMGPIAGWFIKDSKIPKSYDDLGAPLKLGNLHMACYNGHVITRVAKLGTT